MPHPPGGGVPWEQMGDASPADGGKAPNRRRKRADKEPPPPQSQKAMGGRVVKRAKHNHKPEPASPEFNAYEVPGSPPHVLGQLQMMAHGRQQQFGPPQGQFVHTANIIMNGLHGPHPPQDELTFFDRTKKALENGGTYDEFVRLLSLFTRDIIDDRTLVERAEVFLGDGDLMAQFKDLLGWDDKSTNVEYGPPGSIRTSAPDPSAPKNPDDGFGPSYRRMNESVSIFIFHLDCL